MSYTGWDNEKCTSLLAILFKATIHEMYNKQSHDNNYYIFWRKEVRQLSSVHKVFEKQFL